MDLLLLLLMLFLSAPFHLTTCILGKHSFIMSGFCKSKSIVISNCNIYQIIIKLDETIVNRLMFINGFPVSNYANAGIVFIFSLFQGLIYTVTINDNRKTEK